MRWQVFRAPAAPTRQGLRGGEGCETRFPGGKGWRGGLFRSLVCLFWVCFSHGLPCHAGSRHNVGISSTRRHCFLLLLNLRGIGVPRSGVLRATASPFFILQKEQRLINKAIFAATWILKENEV